MAEPKAQLVDPQENMNLPGMNATGVITASSFSGEGGVVTGLTGSPNLNVGVVTATSFVGDGTGHAANLTGTPNLNLGLTTATSFVGDAVGKAAGLTGTPNLNVGLVTATSFAGNVTGDVTGNITGLAASVTPGVNLNVGVATGIQWHGDGSNLTGAGSSAYIAQEVTATGGETIIDLSDGNVIYYKGEANTTVGFASTSPAEQITFIRDTNPNYSISYSTGGIDFDGTGDYLSLAASSDLNLDADFTIEAWVYVDVDGWAGTRQTLLANNIGWTSNHAAISLMNSATTGEENTIILYQDTTTIADSYPVTVKPSDGWTHIAITRSGTTIKIFKNGVQAGDIATSSVTFTFGTGETWIGQISFGTPEQLEGKVSNLRIVKGTALYTDNFIPPSAALTNVTNTKLLCCQSDSSTTTAAVTPGTITANGDPTAGAQTISQTGKLNATITWPSTVKWNNNTRPTLVSDSQSEAMQIFHLTTGDTGASYQAWEEMKNDPAGPYQLWAWGEGGDGQLWNNDSGAPSRYSSPIQLGTGEDWDASKKMSMGGSTGVIKTDGTLWVCGRNNDAELGQNDRTYRSSPVQVPGTNWNSYSPQGGQGPTLATKTDGTLWSWGFNNAYSGLGQNAATKLSSPTQVGTDTTWTDQANGGRWYAYAVKTDGTLWSWGYNAYGYLGQNNQTTYSSPKQVGTDTTWSTKMSNSVWSVNAIKTDGTLWTWGFGGQGSQGRNLTGPGERVSSPTQVGTDTDWSSINSAEYSTGAIKTDGTLWVWGNNEEGNLGQNNRVQYSSPTQLPGTTWKQVRPFAGGKNMVALKTDGTMWSWGYNAYGNLGRNLASPSSRQSSPVQIPGTDWDKIAEYGNDAYGQNVIVTKEI
tara:strand:- start:411 stop:3014 length:2604 start_codon:yes stop_codon:yes gene_type:complete